MKIDTIEDILSWYLEKFISDMLEVFKGVLNRDYYLDEKLKKIISEQNINDISSDDSVILVKAIEAVLNLNKVSVEQISNLIKERQTPDEKLLLDAGKELGIYDKNDLEIIDQVRVFYQCRSIIMLISRFRKYFNSNQYDIFLSHSSIDAREVMGLKLLLLYEHNLTSYVDWLDDYYLNYLRATEKIISIYLEHLNEDESSLLIHLQESFKIDSVIREYSSDEITKKILEALVNSDNFFYLDSKSSRYSKWMPFELGYAKAQVKKPIFRIIIHYKRTRKGSIKYSSFLTNLESIEDLDKVTKHLNLSIPTTV